MNHFIVFSVRKLYCTVLIVFVCCFFSFVVIFIIIIFAIIIIQSEPNPVCDASSFMHSLCTCTGTYSLAREKTRIVQVYSYYQSPLHKTAYRDIGHRYGCGRDRVSTLPAFCYP